MDAIRRIAEESGAHRERVPGSTWAAVDVPASPRESSRGTGRNERVEPAYCRRAVGVHRLTPSPVAIVRPLP